jgi:pimeloyl-ACP methyl ester carboxylesterase
LVAGARKVGSQGCEFHRRIDVADRAAKLAFTAHGRLIERTARTEYLNALRMTEMYKITGCITLTLAPALLFFVGDVGFAQPKVTSDAAEDQRLLPYVEPAQLVDIGGRRINLYCIGSGTPTVVLMAGSSSWSPVWYKTQPVVAQKTRVCAFDRASFGFSDPAPRPQILSDTVNDLHAALKAASIAAPYVLVGHSLGGVEARLYAQRWRQDVAGMILVDTSPAGEELIEANQPGLSDDESIESYVSDELHCAMLAADGPLKPSNPEYKDCSKALPSDTPAAFRKIWPEFFTAAYAVARVSLISSLYTHRYDSVDHLALGAMPLVVLSAERSFEIDTPAGMQFWKAYKKTWYAQHQALAHLSSRGTYKLIKGSSHAIQLDKPQAVIDAVDEVLRQLQSKARS